MLKTLWEDIFTDDAVRSRDAHELHQRALLERKVAPQVRFNHCRNQEADQRDGVKRQGEKLCTCCDAYVSGKCVSTRCADCHAEHFHKRCWRDMYGGFSPSCAPATCACGQPLLEIKVYELEVKATGARLVHTIVDTCSHGE